MSEPHFKLLHQQLIERVVEQIREDLQNQDVEALEELLKLCNTKFLIAYLPEEEEQTYEKLTKLKSNN